MYRSLPCLYIYIYDYYCKWSIHSFPVPKWLRLSLKCAGTAPGSCKDWFTGVRLVVHGHVLPC